MFFRNIKFLLIPIGGILLGTVNIWGDTLPDRSASDVPNSAIGFDFQDFLNDPEGISLTTQNLTLISDAGNKWARIFANWNEIEPTVGTNEFRGLDNLVNGCVAKNMKVLLVITNGPTSHAYGTNSPTVANGFMTPWLNYVDVIVNRYKDRVSVWEIWNEPNLFWAPAINAADYGELARQTAIRIRSLQTNSTLILGGTSLIDINFSTVAVSIAGNVVDAIGIHPYRGYPEQSQDMWVAGNGFTPNSSFGPTGASSYSAEIAKLRTLLDNQGLSDLKIYSTEAGYTSKDESLWTGTQIQQAKNLARYYTLNLGLGIELISWYKGFDFSSLQHNLFTPADQPWQDDYLNGNFPFSTFGLGFLAPTTSLTVAATSYSSSSNISVTGSTITASSANNFVEYTVTIPQAGEYSIWAHFRSLTTPNPGTTSTEVTDPNNLAIIVWTIDGSSFTVNGGTASNFYSLNFVPLLLQGQLVNSSIINTENLKKFYFMAAALATPPGHYYPVISSLSGTATIRLTLSTNTGVDELRLYRLGALTTKPAYRALQSIGAVFDDSVGVSGSLSTFSNNNLTVSELNNLQTYSFVTHGNVPLLAYWVGLAPVDGFPSRSGTFNFSKPIKDPILIDPLSGSVTSLGSGEQSSFTVTVQDYPLILTGQSALFKGGDSLLPENEVFNFPNPARGGTTTLRFQLKSAASVKIRIYDSAHREIHSADISGVAGRNAYDWNITSVANGVYFFKISAGNEDVIEKILVLR